MKYNSHFNFNASQMDKLQEEFIEYQLLQETNIPADVWEDATVRIIENGEEEVKYYRMDNVWGYLSQRKRVDGRLNFPTLSRVAQGVLILPHSNASEERVFSMVTKNKTISRPEA